MNQTTGHTFMSLEAIQRHQRAILARLALDMAKDYPDFKPMPRWKTKLYWIWLGLRRYVRNLWAAMLGREVGE